MAWSHGDSSSDLCGAKAASSRWTTAPPLSGRQESNLRGPGSGPGGQPLTHTLSAKHGVTGGDRTLTCAFTARRAVHYTTATMDLPGARFERAFAVSETAVLPIGRSGIGWGRLELHQLPPAHQASALLDVSYGPEMVLPSGIEPASPALQAGAITRSATRASSRPGWCPAAGIVDYLVFKELA